METKAAGKEKPVWIVMWRLKNEFRTAVRTDRKTGVKKETVWPIEKQAGLYTKDRAVKEFERLKAQGYQVRLGEYCDSILPMNIISSEYDTYLHWNEKYRKYQRWDKEAKRYEDVTV